MRRGIAKTVYDIEETRGKLISLLENFTEVLRIKEKQQMNIWIESDELILVSLQETQDIETGVAALIKLFILRGKALLYDKLVSGAIWCKERPLNETEVIFRGHVENSEIKFQFLETSQSKPRRFVVKSAIFDLDKILKTETDKW